MTDGTNAWAVSTTGHKRLDLTKILNVVLTIDYQYQLASVAPPPEA